MKKMERASYVRIFVFGVEDSLVSTVGLLSGITVGKATGNYIILAGLVLLFVESFSMAVGSIIAEESEEEYLKQKNVPQKRAIVGSLIMFFAYFIFGLIPLGPYFFLNPASALGLSVGATLFSLMVLGMLSSRLFGTNYLRGGIRSLVLGGLAVFVGIAAAFLLQTYSGQQPQR